MSGQFRAGMAVGIVLGLLAVVVLATVARLV